MALQVREQFVQVVNSNDKVMRLHDPAFPRGFVDIPPIAVEPDGITLPARVFKRYCYKTWLWRKGSEPVSVPEPVDLHQFKMAELRAMAREQGITIPVGTSKEEAIGLLKGGN